MLDRLYLPFLVLAAVAAIGFACVWPQGMGDRSPAPFGSVPVQRTPAMQAAMQRETEASQRQITQARAAVKALQTRALDPDPMSDFDAVAVGRRVLAAEAEALGQMAAGLDATFTEAVETLFNAKGRIVLTGIGKSGHVARKIAATLASTGSVAMFVHATEASHGDLGMIGADDVILALSKTGETRELADVIAYAARFDIPLIAITVAPDSALGRAADVVLALPDAPEATDALNAPTTSTTLQLALGDALAVALLERRGFKPSDFRVLHPGGKLGAMLRTVGDLMHGRDELPLVAAATPMPDTLLVMTEKRWGIVGVTDAEGRLAGAITDGDLRRHIDGLLARTAGEVMTAGPKKTVPPTLLASEALALMSDPAPAVTVLFVVEDAKPIGILHVHDILRAGVM